MKTLAVVVVAVFVLLSAGEHAAAEENICGMTKAGLVACLPSVIGASPSPPSGECCTALSEANLPCLCKYKDSTMLSKRGINPQVAKQLPAKCKLSLPKECN